MALPARSRRRMFAADVRCPSNGRASWMRGSNGRVDPRRPSIESAAATSAARASRSASSSASAEHGGRRLRAVDERQPFLRPERDRGEARGPQRRRRRAARAPSRTASPSPTSTSAECASGARSPLAPTDPREGTTACTPAFSSAIERIERARPHAGVPAREHVGAQRHGRAHRRAGSGSPTPAA